MTEQENLGRQGVYAAAAIAHDYDALMGLGTGFAGVGFLFSGLNGSEPLYIGLGAIFAALSTNWYYRRFGFVRQRSGRGWRLAAGGSVALILILSAAAADRWQQPPVSLTLLALTLGLGVGQYLALRRVGLTRVHWMVYGGLVVAAFGPLVGYGDGGLTSPYVQLVIGCALIIVGLTDHLRLVRLMRPTEEGGADD